MNVEEILYKLQEQNLVRLNKISGEYFQIYCPIHNDGNEKKPSCGVLLHEQVKNGQTYPEGFCHCFACGYANTLPGMISDILKNRAISKSGEDWLKENVPGFVGESTFDYLIPQDTIDKLQSQYALDYIQKHSDVQTVNYVSEKELASYRYTVPYMYERRLTDDVIEKYDIGVDMNWIPPGRKNKVPCITFPVRDRTGGTLFFCRRSIQGKIYNYPTGVTKPVYGIYELSKGISSIVICESCINALTAVTYGYNAVALMGTGNSYQIDQLRKLEMSEYILCMDGDEAGRRASRKLKRNLSDVGLVWTINMPEGKDLNDCSKSEFDQLYQYNRE